jgi:hypothetical protein
MTLKVGNLSYVVWSGPVVASTAQMSLSKVDIPLPLEFVYQHLLGSRLIASTSSNQEI